jgi:hypothetical protein
VWPCEGLGRPGRAANDRTPQTIHILSLIRCVQCYRSCKRAFPRFGAGSNAGTRWTLWLKQARPGRGGAHPVSARWFACAAPSGDVQYPDRCLRQEMPVGGSCQGAGHTGEAGGWVRTRKKANNGPVRYGRRREAFRVVEVDTAGEGDRLESWRGLGVKGGPGGRRPSRPDEGERRPENEIRLLRHPILLLTVVKPCPYVMKPTCSYLSDVSCETSPRPNDCFRLFDLDVGAS